MIKKATVILSVVGASAVVARSGTKSAPLRNHLRSVMNGVDGAGSFLKEPLIEAAHGFIAAELAMQQL